MARQDSCQLLVHRAFCVLGVQRMTCHVRQSDSKRPYFLDVLDIAEQASALLVLEWVDSSTVVVGHKSGAIAYWEM